MFNSPLRLAAAAGLIGAFSNTLRLELVDILLHGTRCCGVSWSVLSRPGGIGHQGALRFPPELPSTVPSIVIMVPGLYLYKSFYNLGVMNLTGAMRWHCMATLIVLALPLGLVAARILTDRNFRHCTYSRPVPPSGYPPALLFCRSAALPVLTEPFVRRNGGDILCCFPRRKKKRVFWKRPEPAAGKRNDRRGSFRKTAAGGGCRRQEVAMESKLAPVF